MIFSGFGGIYKTKSYTKKLLAIFFVLAISPLAISQSVNPNPLLLSNATVNLDGVMNIDLSLTPVHDTLAVWNIDDSRTMFFDFSKPAGARTRIEFRKAGWNYWKYLGTLPTSYSEVRLCLDDHGHTSPDHPCDSYAFPNVRGKLYYRFRAESDSAIGPYQYMRPIDLYYDS